MSAPLLAPAQLSLRSKPQNLPGTFIVVARAGIFPNYQEIPAPIMVVPYILIIVNMFCWKNGRAQPLWREAEKGKRKKSPLFPG
jgi:hypothetical protein